MYYFESWGTAGQTVKWKHYVVRKHFLCSRDLPDKEAFLIKSKASYGKAHLPFLAKQWKIVQLH